MSAGPSRLRVRLHDNFALLLASLTITFMITGLEGSRGITVVAGLLNVCSLLIGFATTDLDMRSPAFLGLVGAGLVGAGIVSIVEVDSTAMALGATAQAVLLATLTIAVLGRVIRHTRVTTQTIVGALVVYVLIGQVFAWIYLSLPGYTGESVLDPPSDGELPVYFSYVVLTTVGFGDVTPSGPFSQRLTIVEAVLAQIFIAVLLARLVSVYSAER
ncbi:MAG: potassium channel family protein [Acidimicrobiia bacterium]|nr:potassium channel family protein [Acidimicrobiia bacterium]